MTDDELVLKLRASAPRPKELDDQRFWADFEAGVARRIEGRPVRRVGWRLPALGLGMAAAAAFALMMFSGSHQSNPMPGVTHSVAAEDELVGPGDATELVDDLDLDELKAVENHFNGGV